MKTIRRTRKKTNSTSKRKHINNNTTNNNDSNNKTNENIYTATTGGWRWARGKHNKSRTIKMEQTYRQKQQEVQKTALWSEMRCGVRSKMSPKEAMMLQNRA